MRNSTYILQEPTTGLYLGSQVKYKGKRYRAFFDSIGLALRFRSRLYASKRAKDLGLELIELPGGGSDNE